jgi:hypothetical protein
MATEPKNGAPQRDLSIQRTEDEGERTQECMNDLAADIAQRRARKAAEEAAAEEAAKKQDQ